MADQARDVQRKFKILRHAEQAKTCHYFAMRIERGLIWCPSSCFDGRAEFISYERLGENCATCPFTTQAP